MAGLRRARVGRGFLWLAVVCGVIHAAFSLYWALGGAWLLATIGQWAVSLAREAPALAGIGLCLVAFAKLLAALIPLAVEYGRVPARRFWRALSLAGGVGLILYGGLNCVVSSAVLAGIIQPKGGFDRDAMIGHAWLWDPLFFIWGCALVTSLTLTPTIYTPREKETASW
jgi:hypothetical protein